MKIQKSSACFFLRAQILFALAGIFLTSGVRAQRAARPVENRLLFVFDTSSAMKKRQPSEQKAMNQLFAMTLNQLLQPGDSIGVWTFDRKLRAGQFPLQHWQPQIASTISSNILTFVKKQHYSKTTDFNPLMVMLNSVVGGSEQLTTVIFCDSDGEIQGTPFDSSINFAFKQNQDAMQKAKQPFVIVLLSQFGHYVNYTISSANAIDFPKFLPPPAPPEPVNKPLPPPPPPTLAQPLIIIGTMVTNRLPPPAPKPALTNQTIPLSNQIITNSAPTINSVAPTNAVPPENFGADSGGLLAIGIGFLIAAGALLILIFRRSRKTDSSLITHSMKKD